MCASLISFWASEYWTCCCYCCYGWKRLMYKKGLTHTLSCTFSSFYTALLLTGDPFVCNLYQICDTPSVCLQVSPIFFLPFSSFLLLLLFTFSIDIFSIAKVKRECQCMCGLRYKCYINSTHSNMQ